MLARDYSNLQREARLKGNEMQVLQLTSKTLDTFSDSHKMMKSVGKMYAHCY